MVQCVNGLRRLGKEKALATLREDLRLNGISGNPFVEEKLHLICRLLFVNPDGWKSPRLGQPSPDIEWNVAEKFPFFPIALSDGVPFLLINGYESSGFTSDTGAACVNLCEHFSIITNDLPQKGYKKAAQDLIKSEPFKQLYINPEDREQMAKSIMCQAEGIYQIQRK
jgi:hypothetical protein